MTEPKHLRKPRFFYGYWIVAATFFITLVYSGTAFYAFSLFVQPLQTDFGWGRGEIMLGLTILYLAMAATSPLIGRLVDRYGARGVISIGSLIASLGFVLLSRMHGLWYLYVGWAIVGIGSTARGQIPVTLVVSNWFKRRRGTAVGIMSVGVGAGGLVLAPLIGGYAIPHLGWSASYLVISLLSLSVIPVALLVIKTKPADMGLQPDGVEAAETGAQVEPLPSASRKSSMKMALGTSAFWLIALSFFFSQFSQVGVVQNQVPYLEDTGFPVAVAATALGAVGLGSCFGKFFFGWLCDKIKPKYACSLGLVLQVVAIIILMNIGATSSVAMTWLYAIIMGLGMGSWMPTMSMLTSTSFGLAAYGTVFGMITSAQQIGTGTGPLMAGKLYDAMHTYHLAFIIFVAMYAVAIPVVLAVRAPRKKPAALASQVSS